jgi:hypothetical protein
MWKEVRVLVDSGCERNLVSQAFVIRNGVRSSVANTTTVFEFADHGFHIPLLPHFTSHTPSGLSTCPLCALHSTTTVHFGAGGCNFGERMASECQSQHRLEDGGDTGG